MRITRNDRHPHHVETAAWSRRRGHLVALGQVAGTLTLALLAGCVPSGGDPAPIQPGGTGGMSGPAATGGSTVPTATGGSTVPTATGGSTVPADTGGSGVGPGNTGGSGVGPANTGGSGVTGGSGGNASTGGSAGGRGGNSPAATGGRGGGSTNSGGAAGMPNTGPITPPVPDSASKVPISNAGAGYKVEGNFAYGPLTAQRLDVIYPTNAGPKGTQVLPAVVMFHGGGWVHSYTNNYGSGKDHMSTFFDRFLAHGFMVCNAEYRVNDNTVDGAPAPAAAEDALLAAKWCWDHLDYFHGDKTRYVVTGASAGGHLALMVGMATPAAMLGPTSPTDYKIAGIVSGYGPADIEAEIRGVAAGWFPANLPNRLAIAHQVNPMTYIRKDVPPLIVVQGSLDNTAPVGDSRRLVAMLVAAGADATMHEVPGAGHGYTTVPNGWVDAEKAMFDWLTSKGIGK
jgi:acetyl esterase/lipase